MTHLISMCIGLSVLIIANATGSTIPLQCRDDNNNPVDWYVLYKLPKVHESSNPLIRAGLAYLYITSDTVNHGWQLSNRDISKGNSTPAFTLAPIYEGERANTKMWALYSDNPPNGPASSKYGHTKGVVLADKDQGFWLIHSVPNYPPVPKAGQVPQKRVPKNTIVNAFSDLSITTQVATATIAEGEYDYPSSGRVYGQSFLCISLGADQFDAVATQLMYNQIIIYRRSIPKRLGQLYPTLKVAFGQARIRNAPFNNKVLLRSLGSTEFTSFAKSDKWQRELYDDFVAPQLNADLFAETWLHGRARLPSDCTGAKVYNIESIILRGVNVNFKSAQDHSKWAVAATDSTAQNWICIGDINRANTQYARGGGTVCFNSTSVWSNYRNAVNDVEPCPRRFQ